MPRLRPICLSLCLALAAGLSACSPAPEPAAAPVAAASQSAAQQLNTLYADFWEEGLQLNPVQATFQGDHRFDDQLPDFGAADYRAQVHAYQQRWLDAARAIGEEGLQGQDLLSYRIFVSERELALEGERFPGWMLPVSQMDSLASYAVLLGSGQSAQPFKTVADYDNWLARAARIPVLIDTEIANMRQGMAAGVVQPKVLMSKVIGQMDAVVKVDGAANSLFWGPISTMPADFSEADRERLSAAYTQLIDTQLLPALRKQRDFIANEYLPACRDSVSLGALPDGAAWYAYNARQSTTTAQTPAQLHATGLAEVARIHGEIRQVMAQVGFKGTLQEFFAFMQSDKQFEFADEAALLAHYRALEARVGAKVPELFSLTPKAAFEIRPIEAFRAESAAGGEYMSPSEDGKRPGIFYVNTFDLPTRKTWDAEDLYLHEAIPGHHFQLALQQELTGLPAFRRFGGQTAFIEGWGLYAESLGRELGVYTDPYSYFGRLQGELWRAVRLVVDTGLHDQGWSREQVLAYMKANSSVSEPDAVAEAERYIAWPGQALAYKTGELKIQQLRRKAEQELGEKFDIRAFHAEVLKDGSLPLDLLDTKLQAWIASQQG
ncbi:DUF885 domain-containing protein [Stenotrophomonas ginsengisoli]|uniref:DUF885 domain-containing protein n=1 Tax=Stenotrophomonas ginsengisoli TaxID=336566 RepID=UPI00070F939F|nr:DUF885 family protein [Stenotrophomonas ginsengisoli]